MRTMKFVLLLVVLSVVPSLSTLGQDAAIPYHDMICPTANGDDLQARVECLERVAQAREWGIDATSNLDSDAQLSALLALQAVKATYPAYKAVLPEANTLLHQA